MEFIEASHTDESQISAGSETCSNYLHKKHVTVTLSLDLLPYRTPSLTLTELTTVF